MVFNKKMGRLLKSLHDHNSEHGITFFIDNLEKLFNPNFAKRHDCLIISDIQTPLSKHEFNKVIKIYGDKTGYEASNTEIRINDFIKNDDSVHINEVLRVALIVINVWSDKIKLLCPEDHFCYIIAITKNYVTIRFHKLRTNEIMWLNDDLEGYEEAIGYFTI